jgi:mono/diheme cytochrome c family protein
MTTQTEVTFNQPGKYTFYCTEWCSAAHWRMRGVIEVLGANSEASQADEVPDYARLSIDIDAPRSYVTTPAQRASAVRGAQWQLLVPASMLAREYYISHSPAQVWTTLRALPAFQNVSDQGIWDAVAWLWQRQTSPQAQTVGASLYARNCASCHGATGAGDGPMAGAMATSHMATRATNFTDGSSMLSASPALLEGKVIRGGMGTGMPYWGPIFTDAERRAVVDYLWQFQFDTSP